MHGHTSSKEARQAARREAEKKKRLQELRRVDVKELRRISLTAPSRYNYPVEGEVDPPTQAEARTELERREEEQKAKEKADRERQREAEEEAERALKRQEAKARSAREESVVITGSQPRRKPSVEITESRTLEPKTSTASASHKKASRKDTADPWEADRQRDPHETRRRGRPEAPLDFGGEFTRELDAIGGTAPQGAPKTPAIRLSSPPRQGEGYDRSRPRSRSRSQKRDDSNSLHTKKDGKKVKKRHRSGNESDYSDTEPPRSRSRSQHTNSNSSASRQTLGDTLLEKGENGRWLCPLKCDVTFSRPSDAKRHVDDGSCPKSSKAKEPVQCPYCQGPLSRKDAITRHVNTKHPEKSADWELKKKSYGQK
jgi:hypothetical protein